MTAQKFVQQNPEWILSNELSVRAELGSQDLRALAEGNHPHLCGQPQSL